MGKVVKKSQGEAQDSFFALVILQKRPRSRAARRETCSHRGERGVGVAIKCFIIAITFCTVFIEETLQSDEIVELQEVTFL